MLPCVQLQGQVSPHLISELSKYFNRSDEKSCQLLDLEEGYNKIVPPFTGQLNQNGKPTIIPVPVNISISLLNIVQIQEVDFSITFQFEITLEWLEYRANYNNLKPQIYMNTLTKDDIEKLWLPMVIYKNTDQKERTRNCEWTTKHVHQPRSGVHQQFRRGRRRDPDLLRK